jgi:hypothetical protein
LWNLWTAPPPTSVTGTASKSSSTMPNYSTPYPELPMSSNNHPLQDEQKQQQQLQETERLQLVGATQPQLTTLTKIDSPAQKTQNDVTFFPVHTTTNGHKFILLASQRGKEAPSKVIVSSNALGKEVDMLKTQRQLTTPHQTSIRSKLVHSHRRGLSTPLFIDTVTYETLPSSASSFMYPHHHYRPIWSSWLFGLTASGSILAGGLLAIQALKRMDRWEQLSKEDSLAFDVAYTTTYKGDVESYGSFESLEWSGDRLDRFDV